MFGDFRCYSMSMLLLWLLVHPALVSAESSKNFYKKGMAAEQRGDLDTAAIPAQVRQMVQSVNPELPVYGAQMLDDAVSASLAERRFSMEVVAAFAATALLLAALGLYGVISFIVNERSHEIGVRLALGAKPGRILNMVLRQGLWLALSGAAIGLIGALIGMWLARELALPELFILDIGDVHFPIIWSIIGSALFVAVLSLLTRATTPGPNEP